jgi:hypothetical protein
MSGVSLRLIALCALFTFGSIFSASLIFLEYNHLSTTHVVSQDSTESSSIAELKRLLKEKEATIEQLKSTEVFQDLQSKIEAQIGKQVSNSSILKSVYMSHDTQFAELEDLI